MPQPLPDDAGEEPVRPRLGTAEHAGKLGRERDYFAPQVQRRLKEIYNSRLETVIQSTGVHEGGALS